MRKLNRDIIINLKKNKKQKWKKKSKKRNYEDHEDIKNARCVRKIPYEGIKKEHVS